MATNASEGHSWSKDDILRRCCGRLRADDKSVALFGIDCMNQDKPESVEDVRGAVISAGATPHVFGANRSTSHKVGVAARGEQAV